MSLLPMYPGGGYAGMYTPSVLLSVYTVSRHASSTVPAIARRVCTTSSHVVNVNDTFDREIEERRDMPAVVVPASLRIILPDPGEAVQERQRIVAQRVPLRKGCQDVEVSSDGHSPR